MAQESALSSSSAPPGRGLEESNAQARSITQRLAAKAVMARLNRIEGGRINFQDLDQETAFGEESSEFPVSAHLQVLDPRFYARVALGGSIGAAEAWVEGYWQTDDLTSLIRIFARNPQPSSSLESGAARLRRPIERLAHLLRSPTRAGSRRNITAHYDLGNEFFSLFLDPTMMYSCAIFPDEDATLEEASEHKVEHICRKLDLGPQDRVLEIGSGWGHFALHAARVHGCRVLTTTISPKQLKLVRARIAAAGLEDRVEVMLIDYRDLSPDLLGRFDKVVSIEMIEAVGHRYLPAYFETISEMLEPDGEALIQAITIPDQKYDAYRHSVDFIQRHIFPGGLLPSLARMAECVRERTDLRAVDLEDITEHYPKTLRTWRENMLARADAMDDLGLDERFRRLWEYYFSYCEGGFLERVIGDVQLHLAKPHNRSAPRSRQVHRSREVDR